MVSHRDGGKLLWHDNKVTARNIFSAMPGRDRQHPNEKPLELVEHFLRLHSSPSQLVLDPFMGSGTTGVACVKLGRRFTGIEIDEGYFDIACERIRKAVAEPDMFIEQPAPPATQEALFDV